MPEGYPSVDCVAPFPYRAGKIGLRLEAILPPPLMVASRPKLPKIARSAAMVPAQNQQRQGFARNRGTKGVKNGVPLAHHLNSVQTTIISRTWAA